MKNFGTELFSSWFRGQEKMGTAGYALGMAATAGAMFYGAGVLGANPGIQGVLTVLAGPTIGATVVPMILDQTVQAYDRLTAKIAVDKFVKTHPGFRGQEEELLKEHKDSLAIEPRYRGLLTMMEMEQKSKVYYAGNDIDAVRKCLYQIQSAEPYWENVSQKVVETIQHNNDKFHQSFSTKETSVQNEIPKSNDIGNAVTEVCKEVFAKDLSGLYSHFLVAEAYIGNKKASVNDLFQQGMDTENISVKNGLVLPEGMESISFSTYKGEDISVMHNVTLKPVKDVPGLFRMQEVIVNDGIDYDHNSSVQECNRLVCLDGKKMASILGIDYERITQEEQQKGKNLLRPANNRSRTKTKKSVRPNKRDISEEISM